MGSFTPKQSLTVLDNRTGNSYEVPIKNNAIQATAFTQMKATPQAVFGAQDRPEDETEKGIRVSDSAYANTAAVTSSITFIDGGRGILRYRGYPIEQLARKSHFLESAYLLIYGELPTAQRYDAWSNEVLHHTYLHHDVEHVMSSFRYDSHPMAMLISGFAALGAFAPEANPSLQGQNLYSSAAKGNVDALAQMDKQIMRLIGKAPTLAAATYRNRQGRPFNRPPTGLSYSGTFLYCLDQLSEHQYKPNAVLERALDILFLLHADHEMNCSTATMVHVGSSLVDPYSAVAASCAALYGPLHGGASEAVVRQLIDINGPENVPKFIEQVKRKERNLAGFGHRVYRTTDPRSTIIREVAEQVFSVTGRSKLLDTALALRDAAEKDDYFKSRNLHANVDFFSGIIYQQMGFPLDFYPVLFAVPRVVGWLAHWRQAMLSPSQRIWRPKQIYIGASERDYVDVKQREEAREPKYGSGPVSVAHGGDSKRRHLATYLDETGKLHARSKL
ncbi:citrate synthase [Ceraceosorus bombacis]|uniref:Citrate synthase n=1 Tax=Ceraceosorus bombacis TaxID=401625 RepID=A0A0P1BMM7_9BASI|nr:citrate synthase [Ceraceosorus bombacis]